METLYLFKPAYYVRNYQNVDIRRLKQCGIQLLLSDIDNTLVAWHEPDSNQRVKKFIHNLEKEGIHVVLCSNSTPSRSKRFSADLHVPVYPLSFKPLQHSFKKAMNRYHVTPHQTAIIGDQLLTDILGGNIAGVYTILTAPITDDDKLSTRINRFFERFIYRNYEKRNLFKKGDFDD